MESTILASVTVVKLLVFVSCWTSPTSSMNTRLSEVFAWKELDFEFPDAEARNTAIETDRFVPGNSVITGIELYLDRIFLAAPRLKPGVPFTLNYISLQDVYSGEKSPQLKPYPSLEENLYPRVEASAPPLLVSIHRVAADPCGRLWAIDSGVVDSSTQSPKMESPPAIHVFDLKTDKLEFSHRLKPKRDNTEYDSSFENIVVDVTSGNCDDAFVYLPDSGLSEMVVYSLKTNETHRLTHNYFHFDPVAGDFHLSNNHYQRQDGVIGMALSPIDKDNFRTVYFHPLASTMEFTVPTRVLQNKTASEKYLDAFRILGDRGSDSQSSVSVLDEETGVIFYTQVVRNSIVCWNSCKGEDYSSETLGLVAEDPETMSYPNDLRIDKDGYIWVLTNRLSEFVHSQVNRGIVNMRLFRAPVRDAIKNTICD